MTETNTDNFVDVPLTKPLVRGETTHTSIRLNKPGAPELQGCQMFSLVQMDVTQAQKVLPRISQPVVSASDFLGGANANIDIADLFTMASEIAGFLLGTRMGGSLTT